jgi:hypothetical protein
MPIYEFWESNPGPVYAKQALSYIPSPGITDFKA